ncbi:MAG: hypothetical protein GXO25_02080 [Euryarchaeota archaeon]|nr:hypothetical protein [Euryarchaeota archaeon]
MQKNRLRLFAGLMLLILMMGVAGLSVVKKNIVDEKAEYVLDSSKVLKYGNTIYFKEQSFESLSALSNTGNLTWRFFPQDDDFIVDFTQAGSTVYVLTNAHLYFLSPQGAVLKSISTDTLVGNNSSALWPAAMWNYKSQAYVLFNSTLYVFSGTSIINRVNMQLPGWPVDERQFGAATLLVYKNGTNRCFYDVAGSKIQWHWEESKYDKYIIHYPYVFLFSNHNIAAMKDGKIVWSRNFGNTWLRGLEFGDENFVMMLGSYYTEKYHAEEYSYAFTNVKNFYVTVNAFSIPAEEENGLFEGIVTGDEAWAVWGDYIINFNVPAKDNVNVKATVNHTGYHALFSQILLKSGNTLISAGYYDFDGTVAVYDVQEEYVLNPGANMEYKLAFLAAIIVISGVGIIWLRKK